MLAGDEIHEVSSSCMNLAFRGLHVNVLISCISDSVHVYKPGAIDL